MIMKRTEGLEKETETETIQNFPAQMILIIQTLPIQDKDLDTILMMATDLTDISMILPSTLHSKIPTQFSESSLVAVIHLLTCSAMIHSGIYLELILMV